MVIFNEEVHGETDGRTNVWEHGVSLKQMPCLKKKKVWPYSRRTRWNKPKSSVTFTPELWTLSRLNNCSSLCGKRYTWGDKLSKPHPKTPYIFAVFLWHPGTSHSCFPQRRKQKDGPSTKIYICLSCSQTLTIKKNVLNKTGNSLDESSTDSGRAQAAFLIEPRSRHSSRFSGSGSSVFERLLGVGW